MFKNLLYISFTRKMFGELDYEANQS